MTATQTPSLTRGATTIWLRRLLWGLPFLAAFLPIVLLGFYSYQIAAESVKDLVNTENISAANNISELINQDFTRTANLASALASLPGTIDASAQRSEAAMRARLKAIVGSYPQIHRAFVTDTAGILWADYPPEPGALNKDFSGAQWFQEVSSRGTPYISEVYLQHNEGAAPVVAIAHLIRDASGVPLSMLVFEYKVKQITKWLQSITMSRGGYVLVLDQMGTVVAHPRFHGSLMSELRRDYQSLPEIGVAQRGNLHLSMYTDPLEKREMLATFLPLAMGHEYWVVIAEQSADEAYGPLQAVRLKISLAAAALTLLTIAMVIALAMMSARNERLTQQLRDFASIVSHQLKAPITAMQWTLEMMMSGDYGEIPEGLKPGLKTLQDTTAQNSTLITDILNMSRLERGVVAVVTKPVSLKEIIERALRDYRHPIESAGLSLTLEGTDHEVTVQADEDKLVEAIKNAISNAIKHTKQGGITVRVYTKEGFGFLEVQDTGEGMTPEIIAHLFTRDGILGAAASPEKSVGLGLYIAKNFMKLQKGDVWATAVPGKGSTFIYKIPLA
jgi:signal transduction histidine kinase